MTYDHFKVFSNREKLDKLFSHTQLGKKRFIFIFDEGMFCEAAMALGYSAIYIGTDEELAKVIDAAAAHSFTGRENIIFPLCKKHVTEALWAAMNDTSRLISGAWRYFYAQERTRELYRCRRDLLDAAITKLAADYTVKSIGTVSAKRFSDVEEKPVDWLWEPYIARGCLTILFAEPGAGKTFFTCWLASRLSNGDALPGAPPEKWVEPQKCVSVFFNSEDSEEYTLKPRLRGCGAALENVLCVPCDDCAGLTFSSPDIENVIEQTKPDIVFFDPMQSFLGADIDMHRANQTRPILAKLAALASKFSFAAVLVCHSNKSVSNGGNNRLMGSQDIKGAARSVIFLGVHPQNNDIKAVFQVKNNLGALGNNLAFKIKNTPNGAAFVPDPTTNTNDLNYEDFMDTAGRKRPCRSTQKQRTVGIIEDIFKIKDKYTTAELKELAQNCGINWNTFYYYLNMTADYHKVSYNSNDNYYTIKHTDNYNLYVS